MASKMIGTVARSLHMPAVSQGDLIQQIIEAITAAAAQEGVILHHKDMVGVPHALPVRYGYSEEAFDEKLQKALQQATGVQLKVLLYEQTVEPEHPLCSLCTLMACQTSGENIVLVQGVGR